MGNAHIDFIQDQKIRTAFFHHRKRPGEALPGQSPVLVCRATRVHKPLASKRFHLDERVALQGGSFSRAYWALQELDDANLQPLTRSLQGLPQGGARLSLSLPGLNLNQTSFRHLATLSPSSRPDLFYVIARPFVGQILFY